MEPLKLDRAIARYTPQMSQKSRAELATICTEEHRKGGDLLFEPRRYNPSEYILIDGIARTYLRNMGGEELTLSFYEPHMALPPNVTRTANGKSLFYGAAITDCTFAKIDAKTFESLMIDNLEIRDFGNTALRQELLNKVYKEVRMASWTAGERLEQFRKDFSMLENRVAHPMIASYLGVTNVSLSRLRKQN